MDIAVIGVNHNNAPINIREKVSFTDTKKVEATDYFLDRGINEIIILSTCNRSEIYICASSDIKNSIDIVKDFYEKFFDEKDIKKYMFDMVNEKAINHIYNVCSGLDSIVLGEDQILGQAKDALEFSIEIGSSSKILNKLFREAITTAKDIKSTTKMSENPLSISYIGVKFLREKLHSLDGKSALLIGIGKMSKLALNHLMQENLEKIYICNRNKCKAESLVENIKGLEVIDYDDRYEMIKDVDVVITATASPHIILKKEDMPCITKPLFMMDIALPRDIDPNIHSMENVEVYDIDDLKKISIENEKKRQQLSLIAKQIIDVKTKDYLKWIKSIKVDPTIKSLNNRREEIEKDTLDYIYRKLDLSNKEKKIIEKMMSSALKKLIREPIIKLKETKDEGKVLEYIHIIDELFDF